MGIFGEFGEGNLKIYEGFEERGRKLENLRRIRGEMSVKRKKIKGWLWSF